MQVTALIGTMGKLMVPALVDEAMELLGEAKEDHSGKLTIDGTEYLSKTTLAKLNFGVGILRRIYHAALVLMGKAHAVQFAEDTPLAKQAASTS